MFTQTSVFQQYVNNYQKRKDLESEIIYLEKNYDSLFSEFGESESFIELNEATKLISTSTALKELRERRKKLIDEQKELRQEIERSIAEDLKGRGVKINQKIDNKEEIISFYRDIDDKEPNKNSPSLLSLSVSKLVINIDGFGDI